MKRRGAIKFALPACLLGFLALGLFALPAGAATATSSFTVSATVASTCLVSATSLGFGSYTGLVVPASSTVSVTCTNTTPYNVGLSAGLGTGATVTARKMTGPASALLAYGLFQDAGHTVGWGVTAGTDTVAGTGNGATQPITVYGQIPTAQYVVPGAYADTITVTVTY
jgi:spore coat protein U-like protein